MSIVLVLSFLGVVLTGSCHAAEFKSLGKLSAESYIKNSRGVVPTTGITDENLRFLETAISTIEGDFTRKLYMNLNNNNIVQYLQFLDLCVAVLNAFGENGLIKFNPVFIAMNRLWSRVQVTGADALSLGWMLKNILYGNEVYIEKMSRVGKLMLRSRNELIAQVRSIVVDLDILIPAFQQIIVRFNMGNQNPELFSVRYSGFTFDNILTRFAQTRAAMRQWLEDPDGVSSEEGIPDHLFPQYNAPPL